MLLVVSCGTRSGSVRIAAPAPARPAHLPEPAPAGRELAEALERLRNAEGADASGPLMSAVLSEDPARADQLLVALEGPDAARVTEAFAFLPPPASIDMLRVALRHASPRVREAAVSGLAAIGTPETAADLLVALQTDQALTAASCRTLLGGLERATTPENARLIESALDHATLACRVDARLRAMVGLRGGRLSPAAALPAILRGVDASGIAELARAHGSDPTVVAAAREVLDRSWLEDEIVTAAFFLDAAGDREAARVAGQRLGRLDEDACSFDGIPSPECDALRALVLAAGVLRDSQSAGLLRRLVAREASRSRGREELSDWAIYLLWARAFDGATREVSAQVPKVVDVINHDLMDRFAAFPRVPEPVVAALLARPMSEWGGGVACSFVVHAGAPRWRDSAWAVIDAPDSGASCRGMAALALARSGTPEDRDRLGRLASEIVGQIASGNAQNVNELLWLEAESRMPSAGRPSRDVAARALVSAADWVAVAAAEPNGDGPRRAVELVRSLVPGPTVALSPGLSDRVLARSASPRFAGPAVDSLVAGATSGDLQSWIAGLTRGGPLVEARATAAMLASPAGRLRALASERAQSLADPARRELLRVALLDPTVPPAPLVPLLARGPDRTLAALLVARCDSTCVSPLEAMLAEPAAQTRRVAALVAAAVGSASLVDPLRRAVEGRDADSLEAHVALALLGAPAPDFQARANAWMEELNRSIEAAEQAEEENEEGPDASDARNSVLLLQLAGLEGNPELAHSCDPRSGERRSGLAGDVPGTIAVGALILRTMPERFASLPEVVRGQWKGDLAEAVGCLDGFVDAAQLLRPAATSADASVRRAVAPAVAALAERNRRPPLLEGLAGDPEVDVRRALLSRWTSTPDWLARRLAGDANPDVRADAVSKLPLWDGEGYAEGSRALEDPSADVREAIVNHDWAGRAPFADRLAAVILALDPEGHGPRWGRLSSRSRPPGILPALRRLIGSGTAKPRIVAGLCHLGTLGDAGLLATAVRGLSDEDGRVVAEECHGRDSLLGPHLAGLPGFLDDRDPAVVRLGLSMASRTEEAALLGWIERRFRRAATEIRVVLAAAFPGQAIPRETPRVGERSRDLLSAMLRDPSELVRCASLQAIEDAGGEATDVAFFLGRSTADFAGLRSEWHCGGRPSEQGESPDRSPGSSSGD